MWKNGKDNVNDIPLVDCFARRETTANLHIPLSTKWEQGGRSDSLALSDQRKGGERKRVSGLYTTTTCWRKCKGRHAI